MKRLSKFSLPDILQLGAIFIMFVYPGCSSKGGSEVISSGDIVIENKTGVNITAVKFEITKQTMMHDLIKLSTDQARQLIKENYKVK